MSQRLDDFARNARAQLKERGWTPPELARRAGLAPKTVNNVLNGRHHAQQDVLEKIAAALGLKMWQLWLPELPAGAAHNETFPRLVTSAARLSPDAASRIVHIIDLELKAASSK